MKSYLSLLPIMFILISCVPEIELDDSTSENGAFKCNEGELVEVDCMDSIPNSSYAFEIKLCDV